MTDQFHSASESSVSLLLYTSAVMSTAHALSSQISRSSTRQAAGKSYAIPVMNILNTPILRLMLNCNLQILGIGTYKI